MTSRVTSRVISAVNFTCSFALVYSVRAPGTNAFRVVHAAHFITRKAARAQQPRIIDGEPADRRLTERRDKASEAADGRHMVPAVRAL